MECPFCKEEIKNQAIKCKHCGEWLNKSSPLTTDDIKQSTSEATSDLKDTLSTAYRSVVGSSTLKNPTNHDPLTIDEDLKLYGDYFIHYGKELDYTKIWGISFSSESATFQWIVNIKEISLSVNYEGGVIYLNTTNMYARLKKYKLIENAYLVFSARSRQIRITRYINELNEKGYIDYKDQNNIGNVRIHKNGLLEVGDKSINLQKARKTGTLGFEGTIAESLSGMSSRRNPYEIGASEGSGGVFSRKVVFEAKYNHDVIVKILQWIAEDVTPPF